MKNKILRKLFIFIPLVLSSCSGGGSSSDVSSSEIVHVHSLISVPGKNPTCLVDGNIKYYVCEECGKLFSDAEGTNEITSEDTVLTKTGHHESDNYYYDENEHWKECLNIGCNEHLSVREHTFGDPIKKSDKKWYSSCAICGYEKEAETPTSVVKGHIIAPLDSGLDLTKVQIELINDEDNWLFDDVVDSEGSFTINAPVGEGYTIVASYPSGYSAVSESTIDVIYGEKVEGISLTLNNCNMVGSAYVNGIQIDPICNYNLDLINDMKENNGITIPITSPYYRTSWEGKRRIYAVPLSTQIKKGDFSFIGNVKATNGGAYGYVGIGITDGTHVLTLETSYMEQGFSFIKFGKYEDYKTYLEDASFPFEDGIKCGGIANQTSGGLNVDFTIRKSGNSIIFYVGDVRIGYLNSEEGLIIEGNWQQTYSPVFLKQVHVDELVDFLNPENEYAMLYTSWGVAGCASYNSTMGNFNTVKGKITVPNGYNVKDTRINLYNDSFSKSYYDVIDEDGKYSLDVPSGIYNMFFSHPNGLFGELEEIDTFYHPTANDITLSEGYISGKPFSINGGVLNLNLGKILDDQPVFSTTGYTRSVKTTGAEPGANIEFIMFPNSISNKLTKYSMSMNATSAWGYPGVTLTDGNSIIRVNMANGFVNQIEFEYLSIDNGKSCYVSEGRTYRIKGDNLPTYNDGSTKGDIKVTFEKNSDNTIGILINDLNAITIKADGFYLADGLSVVGKTLEEGNKIPGEKAKPDSLLLMGNREYCIGSCVLGHEQGSGGNVTFKPSVIVSEQKESGHEHDDDLKNVLEGKYLSILGDSISTFDGVSNSTENNDTIGNNSPCYPYYDVDKLSETYWGRLLNDTDMELLVNNSWGGTMITGKGTLSRAANLHANTGDLEGTNPDIIILYMGINDVGHDTMDVDTFKTYYQDVLDIIKDKYPSADLWIMNLPHPNPTTHPTHKVDEFNAAITELVNTNGLASRYIQLSGSIMDNYKIYTAEYPDYLKLHPNTDGMKLMNDIIKEAFYNYYCK